MSEVDKHKQFALLSFFSHCDWYLTHFFYNFLHRKSHIFVNVISAFTCKYIQTISKDIKVLREFGDNKLTQLDILHVTLLMRLNIYSEFNWLSFRV